MKGLFPLNSCTYCENEKAGNQLRTRETKINPPYLVSSKKLNKKPY